MNVRSKESGGALGTVIGLVLVLGIVGGGVWAARSFMDEKEEKSIKGKYFEAKRSDFIVTVKLSGNLASTDVEILKCELEGSTTIKSVIEEGAMVEGPTKYTIKEGDTLKSISEAQDKHELSVRQLNEALELDWDNLRAGDVIQIPGTLLVELDPTNLEERINSQEIDVVKAQSALVRAEGGLETMKLATALELKRAQNSHQNSVLELKKVQNSTVETRIKDMVGTIANLEKDVELAQKNVKAYDGLKELGFVSDVEVLKEKAKEAKTLHQIKIAQAELAAYREYDQVKLISASRLAVDEAEVTIKKTQVKNAADLNDANSTVLTAQKTLELEIEKLRNFQEQMANSRIYAPDKGAVVYWSEPSRHYRGSSEPIMDGAKVHRGQKIMKLPKTDSLKVGVTIPQSSRKDVRRGMKAWVQVENAILRGTVTMLASTVDTNQRNHSNKSGFKAEVAIDEDQVLPDSVSEGMKAKVEILVKELKGKNRLIKIPNQCVTSRTLGEDKSETGCWVLNEGTGENVWRPIIIAYHDEDFIAVADRKAGSGKGLGEGEMILLSPLSEADQLNLEESVQNKGDVKGVEPLEDDGKTVDPLAKGTKLPSDEPSLTDDQKAKLETAKTKMKEKIAQLRAKGLPREEAMNKFKEELKTFLTEQQIAQLEKKRSERSWGDANNSDRRRDGDNVTEESRDKGPRESDREEGPPRKGKKKFLLKKL